MSTISASTTSTTAFKVTADTTGTLVLQTGSTPTTAVTIGTDQSVTFAQGANLPNTFGFKNRIINGGMAIDQRNAGASVTPADGDYTLDRWTVYQAVSGKFSVQQNAGSVTPPTGFTYYLGVTSLSAYSIVSTSLNAVIQSFEGNNVADLGFGTANAATVTISFWVRSSLTGTFGGSLRNSAGNRGYPFTYTINSANTWEQKSITIPGDTTGTWPTTNARWGSLFFGLGVGSNYSFTAGSWGANNAVSATGATSVVGTNGATFYITGVQLEKGSTATSFDFRSYGTELALCQRYFQSSFDLGTAPANNVPAAQYQINLVASGDPQIAIPFPVSMRTGPTVTLYNPYFSSPTGQWSNSITSSANARALSAGMNKFVIDNTDVSLGTGYWGICWSATAEL